MPFSLLLLFQYRLFEQPMVPVVSAEDGQWLLPEPLAPMMKPGGHGAIWKLMLDRGIFDYFSQRRRQAAIVRQIRYFNLACNSPCPARGRRVF